MIRYKVSDQIQKGRNISMKVLHVTRSDQDSFRIGINRVKPGVFAACVAILCVLGTAQGVYGDEEQGPELEARINGLTNRVRAYELRVKAINELMIEYPEKVFPIFISIIRDPLEQEAMRSLAAQKISELNPIQATAVFRQILSSRSEDTFSRRIAMTQLWFLDPGSMKPMIHDAMANRNEDAAIRQYALGLYGNSEEIGKIANLRRYVRTKSETLSMRNNSLFILEKLGDADFVRTEARTILDDVSEPEELRKNCVLIAERLADYDSIPIMLKIAVNKNAASRLRRFVLVALGHMGDGAVSAALQKGMNEEWDTTMRRDMEEARDAINSRGN